jgi:hypothetical protein
LLVEAPQGVNINRGSAFGRMAIETEDSAPYYINDRVKSLTASRNSLGKVLHGPLKLQPHGEEVIIVQDPDGHEYCFVDARGFKTCTDVATKAVQHHNVIPLK